MKIFNAVYLKSKAGALYSNFIYYHLNILATPGFTKEYPQYIKDQNMYRTFSMYFHHVKTYRTELFRKIDKKYFLDSAGNFFSFASDLALYFPVMERACGRVFKIPGFHYLYHRDTELNEDVLDRPRQVKADQEARRMPRLSCD